MCHSFVVEMKVAHSIDNQIFHKPLTGNYEPEAIFAVLSFLDEEIGGAMCLAHFMLPELGSRFTNDVWKIEIRSCCKEHSQYLEKRVGVAMLNQI